MMPQTTATLTCPHCEAQTLETIPMDRCLYFWQCPACGTMLRPRTGDCCVFCSYGSERCPTNLRC